MIKQLKEDFQEQFKCLGENTDTPYDHAKKSQEILWNAKSG